MKTKAKVTTEYRVSLIKKVRLWQVVHVHEYENYSMDHQIYVGSSWTFCMWIATRDPFYLGFDPYFYSLIRTPCGARFEDYRFITRSGTRRLRVTNG